MLNFKGNNDLFQLEIRSVERGICPISTLCSLAAAFQHLTLVALVVTMTSRCAHTQTKQ